MPGWRGERLIAGGLGRIFCRVGNLWEIRDGENKTDPAINDLIRLEEGDIMKGYYRLLTWQIGGYSTDPADNKSFTFLQGNLASQSTTNPVAADAEWENVICLIVLITLSSSQLSSLSCRLKCKVASVVPFLSVDLPVILKASEHVLLVIMSLSSFQHKLFRALALPNNIFSILLTLINLLFPQSFSAFA